MAIKTISDVQSAAGCYTYSNYVIESFKNKTPVSVLVGNDKIINVTIKSDFKTQQLMEKLSKNVNKADNSVELKSILKSKDNLFMSDSGIEFTLGKILKPQKEIPPLGYIGEVIIQSAMFARFLSKNEPVTKSDVEHILNEYLFSNSPILEKRSPNYGYEGKIPDDFLISEFELAKRYFLWLKAANKDYSKYPYNALNNIFSDAVSFANSERVFSHAKELYYNGQTDKLIIEGTGIKGQNITKADIKVYKFVGFNPSNPSSGTKTEINLRVSAKINSVKQFGQVTGLTFDKQQMLFKTLMGVDLTSIKPQYDKLVKSPADLTVPQTRLAAWKLCYESAIKMFNNNTNRINDIVYGIRHFMTLNETTVGGVDLIVVNVGGGLSISDASLINRESIDKYMKKYNLSLDSFKAHYRETAAGRIIEVRLGDKILITVNGRYTSRFANFVEGGEALYEIIEEEI